MHVVLLGILKLYPGLRSDRQFDRLSEVFISMTQFVPKEISRKPQPLYELKRWKATTLRLFLLYFCPVILSDVLTSDYVKHFNCLSFAIRILCDPDDYLHNNETADSQLRYFVKEFETLYPGYSVSNVHALIHLAADSKNFGPLDNFSAFVFENHMQFLKKLLRKFDKPLQQIHRRLVEKIRVRSSKREKVNTPYPKLISATHDVLPLECYNSHRKLQFENFELNTKRPNNCCILQDGSIVIINHIGKRHGEIVVIGRRVTNSEGIANYPIESTLVGIHKIISVSKLEVHLASKISRKAIMFGHKSISYVTPLLHS